MNPPNMPPNQGFRFRQPTLIKALRGPVMMMTLGTVLAVDHFTEYNFGDTWPFLLIVFGLMTLADHAIGRGGDSPYSGS